MSIPAFKSYQVPVTASGQTLEKTFDLERGPSTIERLRIDSSSRKRLLARPFVTIRIGDLTIVENVQASQLTRTDSQAWADFLGKIPIKNSNLRMSVRVTDVDSPDADFGAYSVDVYLLYSND